MKEIILKKLQTCTALKVDWIFNKQIPNIRRQENSELAIVLLLNDMQQALNIDKPMNAEQLKSTAQQIIQDYYWLKLNDVAVFANGCKFGKYGKAYNRLNGQILFEWLVEFDKQRTELISKERIKQHEYSKHQLLQGDMNKLYQRAIEEGRKQKQLKQDRENKERFAAERERQIKQLKNKNED